MHEQTTLGQRIQEGRKAAGLSQEALGEQLNVSPFLIFLIKSKISFKLSSHIGSYAAFHTAHLSYSQYSPSNIGTSISIFYYHFNL